MILLLDNYDSFTYNLYDYLLQLHTDGVVYRNDEVSIENIEALQPDGIVLSPGPKRPKDAGIMMAAIDRFHTTIPILGVCLGFQGIGEYFGATLVRSPYPMHGKTSVITHDGSSLFQELPSSFEVMRYHSLQLADLDRTPLVVSATTADQTPMALYHPVHPVMGVQFHPESILTPNGLSLLGNWLATFPVTKSS